MQCSVMNYVQIMFSSPYKMRFKAYDNKWQTMVPTKAVNQSNVMVVCIGKCSTM